MLEIGERAIELMFSVYCHTDENKDYLLLYYLLINWSSGLKNGRCYSIFENVKSKTLKEKDLGVT